MLVLVCQEEKAILGRRRFTIISRVGFVWVAKRA